MANYTAQVARTLIPNTVVLTSGTTATADPALLAEVDRLLKSGPVWVEIEDEPGPPRKRVATRIADNR